MSFVSSGWNGPAATIAAALFLGTIAIAPAFAAPFIYELGTLGGPNAAAQGISNSGQVAGWANLPTGISHSVRYDGIPGAGGVMRDLGTLGGGQSWLMG